MVPLTRAQTTSGLVAVAVFFIISGFLVTASIDRSQNAIAFVKARLLRIYPGLIGVVLVSIFIVGPLFTALPLSDYFRSTQTWQYLAVLRLDNPESHTLPGLFATNAFPSLINGSLWTLYWEMLCYGIILLLWLTKLLRQRAVLALWLLLLVWRAVIQEAYPATPTMDATALSLYNQLAFGKIPLFLSLAVPFFSGMVAYLYRDSLVMRRRYVLLGLLLAVPACVSGVGFATLWMPTFGAYSVFYLASSQRSRLMRFGRFGDFSYGLYIYAPLIHQSVTFLYGGVMEPLLNFVLTAGITLIPAFLSWHLIEKPALRLKDRSLRRRKKPAVPVVART